MYFLITLVIIIITYITFIKLVNIFLNKYWQKEKLFINETINLLLLIVFSIIATLLTPQIYFIKWIISLSDFLLFLSLSLMLFFVEIRSYSEYLLPNPSREKELIEKIRNTKLSNLGLRILLDSAIPEEIAFRYILLGLLMQWDTFAALVAVSILFGVGHKFSHPDRKPDELIAGILMGFVFGWAYILTGNLIMVILIHWFIDFITIIPIKYPDYANKFLILIFAIALLFLVVTYNSLITAFSTLSSSFSMKSMFLGLIVGFSLFGFMYLIVKLVRK